MAKGALAVANNGWEKEWEIERDFEALCRAEAVRADPKRLEKVRALAKKKLGENKARLAETQRMVDMGEGKNP